jgi:1,4-alpha-glucan branching enzyme
MGKQNTPELVRAANAESTSREPKAIEIWCHAPDAHEVFVAGSFNNWNPKATPMKRIGSNWKAIVRVVPGLYTYNFVVDGKWVCDPDKMQPHDGGPCRFFITHWLE